MRVTLSNAPFGVATFRVYQRWRVSIAAYRQSDTTMRAGTIGLWMLTRCVSRATVREVGRAANIGATKTGRDRRQDWKAVSARQRGGPIAV